MFQLAGLIEPNDGQCHLDKDGYYTETVKQDYPSVSLLHKIIKDRKANVIFAVTKEHQDLYSQVRRMEGGQLEESLKFISILSCLKPFRTSLPLSEYWQMTREISSN